MDKEKLFDYALKLVEANLRNHDKIIPERHIEAAMKEQIGGVYRALAAVWADASKDEKA